MKEKRKSSVWIEKHSDLINLSSLIIGLIGLVITITLAWRLIGKMVLLILLLVLMAIFLYLTIKSAIFLIRNPLNDEIKKLKSNYKEEKGNLQLEIEEKAKQYNALAKHVKLPKAVDKAITVEGSPKWGTSHPHNDIIMYKSGDKFPYLKFYMRVINRTLYYFEPEEVVIGCSIGNHDIGTKKWSIKVRPQGTDIELDSLHEVNDGGIWVRFPIKELYDNLKKWKLDGTVIYKAKGSVIEANKQYMHPEIGIHIEYELPEEQIMKLKQEVEKAIGDER